MNYETDLSILLNIYLLFIILAFNKPESFPQFSNITLKIDKSMLIFDKMIITKIFHAKYRLLSLSKLIKITWLTDNFFNLSSLITSNLIWNFRISVKCIS